MFLGVVDAFGKAVHLCTCGHCLVFAVRDVAVWDVAVRDVAVRDVAV